MLTFYCKDKADGVSRVYERRRKQHPVFVVVVTMEIGTPTRLIDDDFADLFIGLKSAALLCFQHVKAIE